MLKKVMYRKLILEEQPADLFLLNKSALYRRSRELYLKSGGKHLPRVLSSARSLGSVSLLENEIEYNPIASELEWTFSDRLQRKDRKHVEMMMSLITGVYHEQNHRSLWGYLKKKNLACPQTRAEAYRYLNFVESLVIILDMALGDELPAKTAESLYADRVIYNPGAAFMRKLSFGSRAYCNALHVCFHTTYLRLEGLHPDDIPEHIHAVFASTVKAKLIDQCVERALLIEPRFVALTNPLWQKKHVRKVMERFRPARSEKPLILPARKPRHYVESYALAEDWMKLYFS